MKVLYISGMYPTPTYPQKGIFCHEQVKALKKMGISVDVVVPMTVYDKEYTTKVWNYEGVHIQYVRFLKFPGTKGFEHIGASLYQTLIHSNIDFKQYDVLHADAPLPAGDAARRISKKYGIPFVVHGHGLDVFLEESYASLKNCNKISEACQTVYKTADAVAGVSQKVLDKIQSKVDISRKSYVVYNGVDVDKFVPVEHSNEILTITSIGNLIPLKGHDYTIKAVKALVDQGYTNIKLIIAGRGELENDLKQLVQSLELDHYVEFTGYIPYDDIVKLLQNSDIFVLPSWYEALGCVYLEAMACGVPAVGCYGNGIDEVITDGEDGYLIECRNVEQIVDKLKNFIENDDSVIMGKKARLTVSKYFKWEDSAFRLNEMYGELI
jgi:hypothetical protein